MQFASFEADSTKPSIVVDPRDRWPAQLLHIRNVLVVQTVGGSHSAVYILSFKGGKAQQVVYAGTRGDVSTQRDASGRLIVKVPADSGLTWKGKDKSFLFEIE